MHAVAVELDFVQPFVALRRRVDQPGELRRHPFRQRRHLGALACRERSRHVSRTMTGKGPCSSIMSFAIRR
jgi:hypothetical protein